MFGEDSHLVGLFVRRGPRHGLERHPLASTVPRTEPPRTASELKRSAAVAAVGLLAGVRLPSRDDAATEPSSPGACWSARLGKQRHARAESLAARSLQAGHRIPAATAFDGERSCDPAGRCDRKATKAVVPCRPPGRSQCARSDRPTLMCRSRAPGRMMQSRAIRARPRGTRWVVGVHRRHLALVSSRRHAIASWSAGYG